jgi:hypothetical protein
MGYREALDFRIDGVAQYWRSTIPWAFGVCMRAYWGRDRTGKDGDMKAVSMDFFLCRLVMIVSLMLLSRIQFSRSAVHNALLFHVGIHTSLLSVSM